MSAEMLCFSRHYHKIPEEDTANVFGWMVDYYESILQSTTAKHFRKVASDMRQNMPAAPQQETDNG